MNFFCSTLSNISSSVVRDIIVPAIEREVNEGQHFAKLRQIYDAMILATWYKINLKKSRYLKTSQNIIPNCSSDQLEKGPSCSHNDQAD